MKKDELFLMRRKKKITLTEIAKEIGCSIGLLSQFENERCKLSDKNYGAYASYITNKK